MSKFLVLYRSSVPASEQMANATPEQMQAGMDAWKDWEKQAGEAIVDLGAPLGEGRRVGGGAARDGYISGFSVLEADSVDAAVHLLTDHPHLHTPGDSSIEVLEFL